MAASFLPPKAILCYVTDRHALEVPHGAVRERVLVERIGHAAKLGVDWVQLREKDLEARPLLALARDAIAQCQSARCQTAFGSASQNSPTRQTDSQPPPLQPPGALQDSRGNINAERSSSASDPAQIPIGTHARILINDRLDVACAAEADGVHLGETSLPIGAVAENMARWERASRHDNFLVGVSCHSLDEARFAAKNGAHYIFFGPVFATPSKMRFGPPQGLTVLRQICRAVPVPVIAVGGVTAQNAGACLDAGCAGIAAIRLFQQTASVVERAVAELRKCL